MNIVENPSELDRWWTVIETKEGQAVLAWLLYVIFGGGGGDDPDIKARADAALQNGEIEYRPIPSRETRSEGEQHWGVIEAPPSYKPCRAWVDDPSVNGGGTFTGVLRTAEATGNGVDGLHWYAVVTRPSVGKGRHWVNGVVTVIFVRDDLADVGGCLKLDDTQTPAFHYGE